MPTSKPVSAAELSRNWLKYVIDNNIDKPTEDDIVDYLTAAGYEDLAVKKIMNDIQFTKGGKTKRPKVKQEMPDNSQEDTGSDESAIDIDELSSAQINTLNKIKDVIRMKMTSKQRIDLRRYLENE